MPFASQTIRPRRPPVALQAKIVAGHGGQTVTCKGDEIARVNLRKRAQTGSL
ncbi:hypothetical protein E4U27_003052 [Claviceps purpurea]|nr:hypothetical protein E4U27_003052 [Claviceps purpurea]